MGLYSDLKERVQKSALAVLVSTAVSGGTIVYGVTEYFHRQESALQTARLEQLRADDRRALAQEYDGKLAAARDENARLKSTMSSIERRIGGEKFFDVQKIFFSQLPDYERDRNRIEYFEDGEFYAMRTLKNWSYQKTTEIAVARLMLDDDTVDTVLGPLRAIEAKLPSDHVWRHPTDFVFENGPFRRLFPTIQVQKVSLADLEMVIDAMSGGKGAFDPADGLAEEVVVESPGQSQRIKTIFRSDVLGMFLAINLRSLIDVARGEKRVSFGVRNVQKVGPVLYMQTVLTFTDYVVNGAPRHKLYLLQELILVAKGDKVYSVKTSLPSFDPAFTGEIASDINYWLNNFYFFE
ncbi:MAG: hypothetical protein AB7K86_18830 [Rhodospirillales bacterium]